MTPILWDKLNTRAQAQEWPVAALYVVATPIGNLLDFSPRARHALMRCNIVAAEDTRSSKALFQAWGIDTPLMAAHRHNEAQAAEAIITRLKADERVALISDAGAPAISDPGGRIVSAVIHAGFRVIPIPGASAVITALMASGSTSDAQTEFVFAGFAPAKTGARKQWIQQWCFLPAPVVIYEAPHRLLATLTDLHELCGSSRTITIARELTKKFEEIKSLGLGSASQWLQSNKQRLQGEFVLIVHQDYSHTNESDINVADLELLKVMVAELSVRDAVKVMVKSGRMNRDQAYKLALDFNAGRA